MKEAANMRWPLMFDMTKLSLMSTVRFVDTVLHGVALLASLWTAIRLTNAVLHRVVERTSERSSRLVVVSATIPPIIVTPVIVAPIIAPLVVIALIIPIPIVGRRRRWWIVIIAGTGGIVLSRSNSRCAKN
jgi:hypothetical protein